MKNGFYFLVIFSVLFLGACKKSDQNEAERIIEQWRGKKIQLPTNLQATVFGKDTLFQLPQTPYKILLYTDSMDYAHNKLYLEEWKSLIQDADTSIQGQLSFLFYFHPKDKKELHSLLKQNHFAYPVYIDEGNKINRMNVFPEQIDYQCFLLDRNNRVVSVGNPVLNSDIWELYKQLAERKINNQKITELTVDSMNIEVENLQVGETSIAEFQIKNTGNNPLSIINVKTSCGCTIPTWDRGPIQPGETTQIKVEVIPDYEGHFSKTIDVYCNIDSESIRLKICGNVKQKKKKGGEGKD